MVLGDQLDTDWQTFIQLQVAAEHRLLSAEETAAHDTLLRDHRREWIGPLLPWVVDRYTRFRRGFVTLTHARPGVTAAGEHPAWRTVQQLFAPEGELYDQPGLSHLATAGTSFAAPLSRDRTHRPDSPWVDLEPTAFGLGLFSIQLAAIQGAVPWSTLQIEALDADRGALSAALRRLVAPDLKHLMVGADGAPPRGLLDPLRLRTLTVRGDIEVLPAWVALAENSSVSEIVLHGRSHQGRGLWRLTRRGGWRIEGPSDSVYWTRLIDALADALGGLRR